MSGNGQVSVTLDIQYMKVYVCKCKCDFLDSL